MKKYFLISTILTSCAAYSSPFNGSYASLTAGYSHTRGKTGSLTLVSIPAPIPNQGSQKKGGFYGAASLGHEKTWNKVYFAGEFVLSYDASEPTIFQAPDPNGVSGQITYKYIPQIGLGIAGLAGWFLNPQIVGFIRLGVDCNLGYINASIPRWKGYPETTRLINLVPGIGIKGSLNDSMSWTAGLDYRFSVSSQITYAAPWANRPTSLIGKVGISYHF